MSWLNLKPSFLSVGSIEKRFWATYVSAPLYASLAYEWSMFILTEHARGTTSALELSLSELTRLMAVGSDFVCARGDLFGPR